MLHHAQIFIIIKWEALAHAHGYGGLLVMSLGYQVVFGLAFQVQRGPATSGRASKNIHP